MNNPRICIILIVLVNIAYTPGKVKNKTYLASVKPSEKIPENVTNDFRSRLFEIFAVFAGEYKDFSLMDTASGQINQEKSAELNLKYILNFNIDSVAVYVDSFQLEKTRRKMIKDSVRNKKIKKSIVEADNRIKKKQFAAAAAAGVFAGLIGGPVFIPTATRDQGKPFPKNPMFGGRSKPTGKVIMYYSYGIFNSRKSENTFNAVDRVVLEVFREKMPTEDKIWDALLQMSCSNIREKHPFLKLKKRKLSKY
jgi:hypothetical protein